MHFDNSAEREAYIKKEKKKLKKKRYRARKKQQLVAGNPKPREDEHAKAEGENAKDLEAVEALVKGKPALNMGKTEEGKAEEAKAEIKAEEAKTVPEGDTADPQVNGGEKKKRKRRTRNRKKKGKQVGQEPLADDQQDGVKTPQQDQEHQEPIDLAVDPDYSPRETSPPLQENDAELDIKKRWEDDSSRPISHNEPADSNSANERFNEAVLRSIVQHLPVIDETIKVKIADLGNSCWFDHHYSSEIQTRQYRSPEVMLGISYSSSADIWSFACMIFELATGDFLFDPKGGPEFSKEDDHLAQMIEALGKMPKAFALSGSNSKAHFNSQGELRKVKQLKFWPMHSVLAEKYGFKASEAKAFSDFLMPMLQYQTERRSTAEECLKHYWLTLPSNYDTRMNETEYAELMEQLEMKQAELKVRVMRGESLSSPESPSEGSPWEGDVEDNYDRTDSESEKEVEERPMFQEVTEYHERMAKVRAMLID